MNINVRHFTSLAVVVGALFFPTFLRAESPVEAEQLPSPAALESSILTRVNPQQSILVPNPIPATVPGNAAAVMPVPMAEISTEEPVGPGREFAVPPQVQRTQPAMCNYKAEIFAVYSTVNSCGVREQNTGLRGIRNRRQNCGEQKLATVFASTKTCEDCNSKSTAAEIRCESNECACDDPQYINALIVDLGAYSRKVRNAARHELHDVCKYRVAIERGCVVASGLPAYLFYTN